MVKDANRATHQLRTFPNNPTFRGDIKYNMTVSPAPRTGKRTAQTIAAQEHVRAAIRPDLRPDGESAASCMVMHTGAGS